VVVQEAAALLSKTKSLLGSYRAIDLTNDRGFLCGKILADMGAEVIKVENPRGEAARRIGPFYQDAPGPERSLSWLAYNAGKKGITLNIETDDGKALFLKLVQQTDFLLESFDPGYMETLGLGYEALSSVNPGLICVAVTPFGQDGPYRDYKDSDLVCMAFGGIMYITGDPDRPPVRISLPQAYLHAGSEAAAGAMLALFHRDMTGRGQFVDVSVQKSLLWAMIIARPYWDINQVIIKRAGPFRTGLSSKATQRQTWPCKDGYVTFVVFGGAGGRAQSNKALVEWLDREGMANDELKAIDWDAFDMATSSQKFHDGYLKAFGDFFLKHTRYELYKGAVERQIMLYPVATPSDILSNQQLESRSFWRKIHVAGTNDEIDFPGPFVKIDGFNIGTQKRSPLLGEHNEEIYMGRIGLTKEQMVTLKELAVI